MLPIHIHALEPHALHVEASWCIASVMNEGLICATCGTLRVALVVAKAIFTYGPRKIWQTT